MHVCLYVCLYVYYVLDGIPPGTALVYATFPPPTQTDVSIQKSPAYPQSIPIYPQTNPIYIHERALQM